MTDFEKYIRHDRQLSDGTVNNYLARIRDVEMFLKKDLFTYKDLLEVNREEIRGYLLHLRERGLNRSSVANYIIALRTYFNWLAYTTKRKNIVDLSFYLVNIVKIKRERPVVAIPTIEEIGRLRETMNAFKEATLYNSNLDEYKKVIRDIAMLELLITTGLRSGELRSLKYRDVNLEQKTVFVKSGKNGLQRISLFGGSAAKAMKEYLEVYKFNYGDLVFPMKQANVINYIIKRWARKAGINEKIHAHSFRHRFISESQRQGVPAPIVARQVGHNDLNSTLYYTHLNVDTIKEHYRDCRI